MKNQKVVETETGLFISKSKNSKATRINVQTLKEFCTKKPFWKKILIPISRKKMYVLES